MPSARIVRAATRGPGPLIALLLGVMITVASCGGSSAVESATDPGSDASTPSAADLAEQNTGLLTVSEDPLDTEVLSVTDGSVASLRAVVDGDRPVLLWFYAPH